MSGSNSLWANCSEQDNEQDEDYFLSHKAFLALQEKWKQEDIKNGTYIEQQITHQSSQKPPLHSSQKPPYSKKPLVPLLTTKSSTITNENPWRKVSK